MEVLDGSVKHATRWLLDQAWKPGLSIAAVSVESTPYSGPFHPHNSTQSVILLCGFMCVIPFWMAEGLFWEESRAFNPQNKCSVSYSRYFEMVPTQGSRCLRIGIVVE